MAFGVSVIFRPDGRRRNLQLWAARSTVPIAQAVVRVKGLEPPRPFGQQILSLPRLPFRHTRV